MTGFAVRLLMAAAAAAAALGAASGGAAQPAPAAPRPPPAPAASDGMVVLGRCSMDPAAQTPAQYASQNPPPLRTNQQLCLESRSYAGFVDIFDGKSLAGWDGAPGRWSVVDGVLTGTTTADSPLSANTFLIWTGAPLADFDIVFEWRLTPTGNSGFQYRSERMPALGSHVLRGPQYDMGGGPTELFTANLFEERGVTFLASRGTFSWERDGRRDTIGFIGGGQSAEAPKGGYNALRSVLKTGDWNRGEIIARGDTIIQLVNDQVVAMTIDESPTRRKSGVFGIQLHVGPPMKIEFRAIRLKRL